MSSAHRTKLVIVPSLQDQLRRKLAQSEPRPTEEAAVHTAEPAVLPVVATVALDGAPDAKRTADALRDAFLDFLFKMVGKDSEADQVELEKLLGAVHYESLCKIAAGFQANVPLRDGFGVQQLVTALFGRILSRGRELATGLLPFLKYGLDAQERFNDLVSYEEWAVRKEGLSMRELWVLDKADRAACDFYRVESLHPFAARSLNNSFNMALTACRTAQTPEALTYALAAVWNAFEMRYRQIEDAKATSLRLHAAMHVVNLVREQAQATRKLAKERSQASASARDDGIDYGYISELEQQGHRQAADWVADGIVPDAAVDPGWDEWHDHSPSHNINGQPMTNGFDIFGNTFGVTFNDPF